MRPLLTTMLLIALLAGCAGDPFWLPRADRITIQQGNLLSERQLGEIEVGMDLNQVRDVLGSPVASSPFQQGRWNYIYTRGPAGAAINAKQVAIYFEDEVVTRIDTNADIETGEIPDHRNWWERLFPPARERTGL